MNDPSDSRRIPTPELQDLLVSILLDFRDLCDRHDVQFFLDAGTLLGAIRHEGWIPWDDDLDITMKREALERLQQIPEEAWTKADLKLLLPWRSPSATDIVRVIRPSQPIIRGEGRFGLHFPEWQHLCIDLFVIESCPSGVITYRLWRSLLRALQIANLTHHISYRGIFASNEKAIAKIAVTAVKVSSAILPSRLIQLFLYRLKALFRNELRHALPSHPPTYWKSAAPQGAFAVEEGVLFESESYLAPSSDSYLSYLYGPSYLQPPPPDDREPPSYHHAYRLED